jgi:hypothetical protein
LLTAALGLSLLCAAELTQAFNPQPDPPGRSRFGMVGIVRDQTIRISVVALLPAVQSLESPPDPCNVTLGFFDASGRALGEFAHLSVARGKAVFLDLPGSRVEIDDPNLRKAVHPVVIVQANANGHRCRNIAATVEVFDATGRTSVLIEDPNL